YRNHVDRCQGKSAREKAPAPAKTRNRKAGAQSCTSRGTGEARRCPRALPSTSSTTFARALCTASAPHAPSALTQTPAPAPTHLSKLISRSDRAALPLARRAPDRARRRAIGHERQEYELSAIARDDLGFWYRLAIGRGVIGALAVDVGPQHPEQLDRRFFL